MGTHREEQKALKWQEALFWAIVGILIGAAIFATVRGGFNF